MTSEKIQYLNAHDARVRNKRFFDSMAQRRDLIVKVEPRKIAHILDVAGIGEGEATIEWLVKTNLAKGGSLVIAFPESRNTINNIPHHNDHTCYSSPLPSAADFETKLAARSIRVDLIEDNDDFFILRITI